MVPGDVGVQQTDVRPAATVMLVRDTPDGLEVLMVRRSSGSAFAPDAYVFPGGTVDAQDLEERSRAHTRGIDAQDLGKLFRMQRPLDAVHQAGLLIAALRELYEESGVLFACTSGGTPITARDAAAEAECRRGFATLLEVRGWYADARPLVLFSHWITPPSEPRRYDTHFFVAPVPAGQSAVADAAETHDEVWITPDAALARAETESFQLIFPTRKHLERLRAFRSVDELLDFARSKPILTIALSPGEHDGFSLPPHLEDAW